MSAQRKILAFLFASAIFLFSPRVVFAAEITITSSPNSVVKLEEFDVGFSGQQLDSNSEYYLKARIGKEGQTPNKGETHNPLTGKWLYDSSPWVDFPTAMTDGNGNLSTTVKARAKDTVEVGVNKLTVRLRKVGSSTNVDSSAVNIEIKEGASPALTPTPTPTPSPTPTSTPTPSPSTATYKINEVKDEEGNTLSSVKVYVDETYVHHYAPETLTFCDGCQCDSYVDCGFGEHTIKLEKTGFENWSETETINSGDSYEVNPVMVLITSSSPTPSPTPSSTPTPRLRGVGVAATLAGEILGEEASPEAFYPWEATQEAEEAQEATPSKRKILPFIFLGLGLIFLFFAAFSCYTKLRWPKQASS